jgi:hypothetical protein
MNYLRIHDAIIDRARNRTLQGYTETHHVIPRCMGGSDDKTNLVELTAQEHFIVHKLLCEIYPDEVKLMYAYWAMCNKQGSKRMIRDYKVSSREYERAKLAFAELSSKLHSGKVSWNRGLKTNKPSWNRGITHSDETKRKIGLKSLGRKQSPETIAKRSKALKGRIPWNKGKPGWKAPSVTCPHCSFIGCGGSMIRWHFDNCKTLKSTNNSL